MHAINVVWETYRFKINSNVLNEHLDLRFGSASATATGSGAATGSGSAAATGSGSGSGMGSLYASA